MLITLFIRYHLEQVRDFSLALFNKYGVKSLLLTTSNETKPSEFVFVESLKSIKPTLVKLGYTTIFTDNLEGTKEEGKEVCGFIEIAKNTITCFGKVFDLTADLDSFIIALVKATSSSPVIRMFNNQKYLFDADSVPEEYMVSAVQVAPHLLDQSAKVCVSWNFGDCSSALANFRHLTSTKVSLVTSKEPGNYSVVINNSENLDATSIYFCMEPVEYALACQPLFLGTHARHLNNCEWHLSSTLAELKVMQVVKKFDKVLSVVVSAKAADPGHIFRLAIIQQLDEMDLPFGLDIYGRCASLKFKNYRGELPPLAKDSALFPYKYHLNVENHYRPNYITEKLYDGLCAECLTFYKGAPNYTDYFDAESVVELSGDLAEDIALITSTITNDEYEKRKCSIVKNKLKILDQYGFEPRVVSIIALVQTFCFVSTCSAEAYLREDGFKNFSVTTEAIDAVLKDGCLRSVDLQIPVFFCLGTEQVKFPFDRLCFAFAANSSAHGFTFGGDLVCLLPGGAEQVLKKGGIDGLKLYKA